MIYHIEQQDPVFQFQTSFVQEPKKLALQLNTIGITNTHLSLSLGQILSNISIAKGPEFFTKHFGKTNPDDFIARGKLLETLFAYNLLRPKQLDEEFGTDKFENVLHNIKENNWNLTAFDKTYGPKSTEYMFKHLIKVVQRGDFPQDFPMIIPGHHLYPKKPEELDNENVIMLQRNIDTGHKTIDAFDVMYFMNRDTHIMKSYFR